MNGYELYTIDTPIEEEKASHTPISELVEAYDWNSDVAYAVMMAESGGNPDAINWNDYHPTCECHGSVGLFQLAMFWGDKEDLLDPAYNVRRAHEIWQEHGWEPWSAYTNGSFEKFL